MIDLDRLRRDLADTDGSRYWKSLEEAAGTPAFREMLEREFPSVATEFTDPVGRRRFLSLMGSSLALAGLTSCTRQPAEWIAPYAEAPENLLPGRPLYYATALTLAGWAAGALIETHEGRPTKVEGNPAHPASLGATDAFMQCAMLGLYDPDRSRTLTFLGDIHPWSDLVGVLAQAAKAQTARRGAGLRILTETVTSPSVAHMIRSVLAALPEASWYVWEPCGRDSTRDGLRLSFGEDLAIHHDYGAADVVVALDADVLGPGPGSIRAIRDFTRRRRAEGAATMNRLYVAEPTPTGTGAMADHRLPVTAGEIDLVVRALVSALGQPVWLPSPKPASWERIQAWARVAARDLRKAKGAGLVVAGDGQPPHVHAIVHAINHLLGSAGRTVRYSDPIEVLPGDGRIGVEGIRRLTAEMAAGKVELLLILGGNPAYSAPPDLGLGRELSHVGISVHLGLHADETAALCHWHVPQAHELEAWGDARALDGTATIQQPMIEPLYGGRTALDLLAMLTGQLGRSSHELIRDYWKGTVFAAGEPFDRWWRRALHDGVVERTEAAAREVTPGTEPLLKPPPLLEGADVAETAAAVKDAWFEVVFRPDASVWDGRHANNGWLQELPRPATRLTWDNAALLSPRSAESLGVVNGDMVEIASLALGAGVINAPIWIVPGQAPRVVVLHLGYGRRRAGRVAEGAGFDAGALRTSEAPWIVPAARVRRIAGTHPLVTTQDHHSMEGRRLVRWATLKYARQHPEFAQHVTHEPSSEETLYEPWKYEGHSWGMVIDLNSCVGCNACVVGCQAENNIPVVGKEQVANGREMHWIRVDRYFEGGLDEPAMWHQPVTCMHCENAPCEPVCPVGATVHSSEGLNDMVYNRCVGTRYCSNNCPYKVRRFNFLLYSDFKTPSLKLLNNPDVSVRSRGVMEKCTYCVQRINAARVEAHKRDRSIGDGDVVTACQQACPASAITFGDLNDPKSRVSRLKADPRNYGLLTDLNTRPRTTYLAALRNPSPDMPSGPGGEGNGEA